MVSDYATLMVEILKDNGRPEAGEVYGGPWICLGPNSSARSPRPTESSQPTDAPTIADHRASDVLHRPIMN